MQKSYYICFVADKKDLKDIANIHLSKTIDENIEVLKQFKVFNMQQEKIYGLTRGVYVLKVQGLESVKIIVQ